MLQNLHPVHTRQAQIQDHNFGTEPIERGETGLPAQLPGDLIAEALEVVPDAAQNIDIVIDQ
jgi:hypothetical protein